MKEGSVGLRDVISNWWHGEVAPYHCKDLSQAILKHIEQVAENLKSVTKNKLGQILVGGTESYMFGYEIALKELVENLREAREVRMGVRNGNRKLGRNFIGKVYRKR